MAFDQAAVNALFASVQSHALTLGVFERVNQHEPKSAPGLRTSYSFWVDNLAAVPSSGLAQTSGRVIFKGHIYKSFIAKPEDRIDPDILTAASVLFNEYAGHFTLDGTARQVDIFGQHGVALDATAGYIEQDGKHYRVMQVTLPVIINDLWQEAA